MSLEGWIWKRHGLEGDLMTGEKMTWQRKQTLSDVATNQGTRQPPKAGRGKKKRLSPEPSRRNQPYLHLDFSLIRLISQLSGLQKCKSTVLITSPLKSVVICYSSKKKEERKHKRKNEHKLGNNHPYVKNLPFLFQSPWITHFLGSHLKYTQPISPLNITK